jgi:ATP-binding cassette, subfamily B (MDR/TAP), member 1
LTDSQIRELQIGTSQPLGFSVQYVVQALASFGLAFYTSWKLTLVILAALSPAAVVMSFISSMMQPSTVRQEVELSLASKIANSALSAIETVKCFNGQSFELQKYRSVIFKAAKHYIRQALSNALQIGFIRFVTTAMFVQGFWYGGYLVRTNKASAGDVLTTFWACLMATKAIEDILPHMLVLERGRAAGAAMTAILDQVSRGTKIDDTAPRSAPRFCDGDIEVRKVSMSSINSLFYRV